MIGTTVQIIRHSSGDFKVTTNYPMNFFDLKNASTEIYFEFGTAVRSWPIVTEAGADVDRWVYWFISPTETDDSYLDHEVLN